MDDAKQPLQLKTLFNHEVIEHLADIINSAWPDFAAQQFMQQAADGLEQLELKQRSKQICDALAAHLPPDFSDASQILLDSMGAEPENGGIEGFEGFRFMPYLDFVEHYGLTHPQIALERLAMMTRYFSAEFAIRPYILRFPELTLPTIESWAKYTNWKVRRLASEGTRPRLPWGMQLKPFINDPSFVIGILNKLYKDKHLIVRRSVANNLNDIAKDHPDIVIRTARKWWRKGSKEAQWTVKHALRSLVKASNKEALAILGFVQTNDIKISELSITPNNAKIGGQAVLKISLMSQAAASVKIMLDYALQRPMADAKRGEKVFKLKQFELAPGESMHIQQKVAFKQLSTRTYYPGSHRFQLILNGEKRGYVELDLAAG